MKLHRSTGLATLLAILVLLGVASGSVRPVVKRLQASHGFQQRTFNRVLLQVTKCKDLGDEVQGQCKDTEVLSDDGTLKCVTVDACSNGDPSVVVFKSGECQCADDASEYPVTGTLYLKDGNDYTVPVGPCTVCVGDPPAPCTEPQCCDPSCSPEVPCGDFIGDGKGCGDPHFIGFDGTQYDVMGKDRHMYSLISAPQVAVNARLGNVGDVQSPNLWMTEISVVSGNVTMSVALSLDKYNPQTQNVYEDKQRINRMTYGSLNDVISVTVNGQDRTDNLKTDATLQLGPSVTTFFPWAVHQNDPTDGPLVVVSTPQLEITVFIETEGVLHLDFAVNLRSSFPDGVHGLIGQSMLWSKVHGINLLEGSEDDYIVDGTYSTDFKYSLFNSPVTAATGGRSLLADAQDLVARSFACI